MKRRLDAGFGTLLLIALSAARAQAAPGDATRLDYARSDRAASCPDRDALQSAVVKRLGYDPFFPVARQTIVVQILDDEAGLRAEMHLVDAEGIIRGSRELTEDKAHCDELVAALALAISIALDPSAALRDDSPNAASPAPAADSAKRADEAPRVAPDRPEIAPETARSAPRAAAVSAPPRPAHPTQTEAQLTPAVTPIGLRASVFGAVGVAPGLAAGYRMGASVRRAGLALVAEFSDQLSTSRDSPNGGTVHGSVLAGTLAPCLASHAFAGCAVLDVGSLKAEGTGVPQPVKQRLLYLALGTRIELEPRLFQQLYLLANVEALKSPTPVTLRLRGESVWQTPFASLLGSVGVEWKFQ